jgi:DNA polymerase III epsilon subunit-like protein
MGTAKSGDTELIRLSAIDYFTGEVLINNIVDPDQPMEHLNTRYSGVTWGEMNYAVRKNICLKGKQGAREALWRFVGPDTILMGHSVSNDLRSLRWIHPRIVDSFFIEFKIVQAKRAIEAAAAKKAAKEAADEKAREVEEKLRELEISGKSTVIPDEQAATNTPEPRQSEPKQKKPKGSGDLALKSLLKRYLDRDIQMQGKKGHDSLEDAISARDLVHFMVTRSMMEKA